MARPGRLRYIRRMDRDALVPFARARGLAVLATTSADGRPQAAVVGIAITDDGDIVFDTTRTSRKFANLTRQPRVALVIGFDWADEQTVQIEGAAAEIPQDNPAVAAYYEQFPTGRERAAWPDIAYVRIHPDWGRYSDYRRKPSVRKKFRCPQHRKNAHRKSHFVVV
jgi:PPOX class probable F420-dependent enzyme